MLVCVGVGVGVSVFVGVGVGVGESVEQVGLEESRNPMVLP